MSKYTPGPWVARAARELGWLIFADDDEVVESLDSRERYGTIHSEADAHLIAAAPDLLEALEQVFKVMKDDMPVALKKVCYETIEKAKGENNE